MTYRLSGNDQIYFEITTEKANKQKHTPSHEQMEGFLSECTVTKADLL